MKKVAIIGLLIIFVFLLVIIGLTPQRPIGPREPVYVTDPGTKELVKNVIINELDGDVQVGDFVIIEDQCIICDDDGECEIFNTPCWKVNITQDYAGYEATVADSEGGTSGGGASEPEIINIAPLEVECRYIYSEQTPQINVESINNDCNNPIPTCDQTEEKCRVCHNNVDCIRSEILTDLQTDNTIYSYNTIGTVYNGKYIEESSTCIIDDSTIIIYTRSPMTFEDCKNEIFSHAECNEDGICEFI